MFLLILHRHVTAQTNLEAVVSLVLNHSNKASITIKASLIFLLVEGLTFSWKKCNIREVQ